MSDLLEEIRKKLPIEDVVGEYVTLKKSGRTFKGLCPFHKEKTPSFIVTPDKELAYCFGCHTGGDIFEFIQKVENVDFPESIKILARKAGLEGSISSYEFKKSSELTPLFDFQRKLMEQYEKQLQSDAGKEAREYIEKRGVVDKTIQDFRIGFAVDEWDSVMKLSESEKLSASQVLQTGSVVQNESGKVYDRFRNRIMFPLVNAQGSVLGFSGRALAKDEQAKYVNSSDSPLFSKRNVLFGLYQARQSIKEMKYVIVAEGQFDVVLSHQCGLKNTVATSGTAFTEDHLALLSRYTKNIVFAFDADRAGVEATKKAIELAMALDWNVKIVTFPSGKDPADIARDEGREGLVAVLKQSKTPLEFYLQHVQSTLNLKTSPGKKEALKLFAPLYHSCTSDIDKTEMLKFLEIHTRIREEDIRKEFEKNSPKSVAKPAVYPEPQEKKMKLLEFIFAFMVVHPITLEYSHLFDMFLEYIPEKSQSIYMLIKAHYNAGDFEAKNLLADEIFLDSPIPELALLIEDDYPHEMSQDEVVMEYEKLIERFKSSLTKYLLRQTTLDVKIAEMNGDIAQIQKLQQKQIQLLSL